MAPDRRHEPLAALMNVEIFDTIHRAGLVIVDLTGVRPNCLMELGYALGRHRRVIISARVGTPLPFDSVLHSYRAWPDPSFEPGRPGAGAR